ncbi:hypothetical protein [Pseudogemmobacter sp. W21_MBD1_M6]|uniref:hypothetical protein n=1 Tax=Pseudogemmobacter sp. W21_MBD1_M6 TaxID=3240271 RepID=UPI003F97B07E
MREDHNIAPSCKPVTGKTNSGLLIWFRGGAGKAVMVVLAYALCHGATALFVYPLQSFLLADITVFASLVYLPHGVRVLSTFFWGWKAVPVLFVAGLISDLVFMPAGVHLYDEPTIYISLLVGAASAFLGFEALRFLGLNYYSGQNRAMNWTQIVSVGIVASLFNSVGQSITFSGRILPEDGVATFVTYVIGDVVGLVVAMFVLMLIFRWIRFATAPEGT